MCNNNEVDASVGWMRNAFCTCSWHGCVSEYWLKCLKMTFKCHVSIVMEEVLSYSMTIQCLDRVRL